MLKHRPIVIVFLITILVLSYLNVGIIFFVLILLGFISVEIYGAAFIRSNFHLLAICEKKTNKKIVSITFDDGPSDSTSLVLDILKTNKIPATFFVIGNQVSGREALLQRMDSEGHTIGNHSFSHNFWFDFKSGSNMKEDLHYCEKEIERSIGKKPILFRPPYGVSTPALAKAIKILGYSTIGWNIRSLDTKIKDSKKIIERIKRKLKPGSIILLHDNLNGAEILLKDLLDYFEKHKYEVVKLEDLLQIKAYA